MKELLAAFTFSILILGCNRSVDNTCILKQVTLHQGISDSFRTRPNFWESRIFDEGKDSLKINDYNLSTSVINLSATGIIKISLVLRDGTWQAFLTKFDIDDKRDINDRILQKNIVILDQREMKPKDGWHGITSELCQLELPAMQDPGLDTANWTNEEVQPIFVELKAKKFYKFYDFTELKRESKYFKDIKKFRSFLDNLSKDFNLKLLLTPNEEEIFRQRLKDTSNIFLHIR